MQLKSGVTASLAALARAALPPGAAMPASTPALASGQPAGIAPQGATPSQAGAVAWDEIIAEMNAERGLQPGPNVSGPGRAYAAGPGPRGDGAASPDDLAAQINAEFGVHAGPNPSLELAARFAHQAEGEV
jgi:hypothetical protein